MRSYLAVFSSKLAGSSRVFKHGKITGLISLNKLLQLSPALLCIAAFTQPVDAQAQTTLEEIEVIADDAATPRTGDVVESEHTGSRSRLTKERLEQPGAELGNLLGSLSGVRQQQAGGFGSYSSITVRAASAAQTAVYLDGILLTSSGEPVIDLSTLEILNLASVDIYKGTTPLQLGHGSIGGAVNLNTLGSDASVRPKVRLGIGSFSHLSLSAANQVRTAKWDWTGAASHQQVENDFPYLNDFKTPLVPNDNENEIRQNNDVSRSSLLLKGRYRSSDFKRSNILLQLAKRDLGVPEPTNNPNNTTRYDTLKTQLQFSQTVDQWRGWNTRHSLYLHQSDSLYDNSEGKVGLGKRRIDSDTTTLGAKAYWERFIDAGTFGLSIDARRETLDLHQENFDRTNVVEIGNIAAERDLLVTTAHLAFMDASEKFLLTPAIRWQKSSQQGESTISRVSGEVLEQNESDIGGQIGASFAITPQLTLSANAGKYFREPTFGERFGTTGLTQGNARLTPEKGLNLDVSLKFDNEVMRAEVIAFQSLYDELILTSYDSRGFGSFSNSGEVEVTGIELSVKWTPSSVWQISANTTIQNPRNRDPFRANTGKLLPNETKQSAYTRMQYQPGKVAYWYEWQAERTRFFDEANLLPANDTSLHHIGLDTQFGLWAVSARLQNISDDIVQDFNGFHKPGRSFSMAITRTL